MDNERSDAVQVSLIERPSDTSQVPIDAEMIRRLYASTDSDLPLLGVEEFASGLFNNTYRLIRADGENWILRVSPAPPVDVFYNELNLMRREITIAPQFESLGDLFPNTLFSDCTRAQIDRDFVIQNELPGVIWDSFDKDLSNFERKGLWQQLGEVTARIHAIEGSEFGFPKPTRSFGSWSDFIFDLTDGMITDLRNYGKDTEIAKRFLQTARRHQETLDEIDRPYLGHGDIWPKNVLVDRSTMKFTGLLDCERAYWGDPLAEWVFHLYEIPPSFWDGYGRNFDSPQDIIRRQIYRGLFSVQMLLEAIRFKFDDEKHRNILAEQIAALT